MLYLLNIKNTKNTINGNFNKKVKSVKLDVEIYELNKRYQYLQKNKI